MARKTYRAVQKDRSDWLDRESFVVFAQASVLCVDPRAVACGARVAAPVRGRGPVLHRRMHGELAGAQLKTFWRE